VGLTCDAHQCFPRHDLLWLTESNEAVSLGFTFYTTNIGPLIQKNETSQKTLRANGQSSKTYIEPSAITNALECAFLEPVNFVTNIIRRNLVSDILSPCKTITYPTVFPNDTFSSWWLWPQSLPRAPLKFVLCLTWHTTKLKCGYFCLNFLTISFVHCPRIYKTCAIKVNMRLVTVWRTREQVYVPVYRPRFWL